jgi:hypothetical protein
MIGAAHEPDAPQCAPQRHVEVEAAREPVARVQHVEQRRAVAL